MDGWPVMLAGRNPPHENQITADKQTIIGGTESELVTSIWVKHRPALCGNINRLLDPGGAGPSPALMQRSASEGNHTLLLVSAHQ